MWKNFKFKNKDKPFNKVCIGMPGQYGDIVMQEPALRKFIEDNPDTKIILACAKKYEQILPLFSNYHENIIGFKAWDSYVDQDPSDEDLSFLNQEKFDAMFPVSKPVHDEHDWAKKRHITTETGMMMGLDSNTKKIKLNLPDNLEKIKKTVSVHLFSSKWPNGIRSVSIEKQKLIVQYLLRKGYKVFQISSPSQPKLPGVVKPEGTYYDACLNVLKTDFLISCDSGMPWVTSAFNHPTIALFSSGYNPTLTTTEGWHPVNKNSIYLESHRASNISIYKIYEAIDTMIRRTSE